MPVTPLPLPITRAVLAERKAWSSLEHRIKPSSPLSIPQGRETMLSRDIGTSNAFVGQIIEGQLLGVLKCTWASSTFVMWPRPTYWR